jgi:dephospho-CoA kinase
MKVIGLTGGIGMGKSTAAASFRRAGIPVFDADLAVHRMQAPGGRAVRAIAAAFPDAVPQGPEGRYVDRTRLRALVLGKPDELRRLEGIIHPMVREEEREFLARARRAGRRAAVLDIPLLFETGGDKRVDAVVVVTTSPEIQRERILARGTMTNEALDAILARQMPDAEKRKRADFVVDTSHGLDPVRARIRDILDQAIKMPQRRT